MEYALQSAGNYRNPVNGKCSKFLNNLHHIILKNCDKNLSYWWGVVIEDVKSTKTLAKIKIFVILR